jgi:hypothetical protein
MGDLPLDRHLDGILLAIAGELAAGEILRCGLQSGIDAGMN